MTILARGIDSWILHPNITGPILITINVNACERHSCLETIDELYEHDLTRIDAMVNPHVCPEVNEGRWNRDSDAKTTVKGLKSSLQSFGVTVGFTVLKNSLDYLKGLSAKL